MFLSILPQYMADCKEKMHKEVELFSITYKNIQDPAVLSSRTGSGSGVTDGASAVLQPQLVCQQGNEFRIGRLALAVVHGIAEE